jgi:ATP-dependent 26S proteasome regulatory subunit
MFGLSILTLTVTGVSTVQAIPQNSDVSVIEASTLIAQQSSKRRIQFKRGTTSATVSGAIVTGNPPDNYVVGAGLGQKMTVSITSEESNAVFNIIDPSGEILVNESKSTVIDVLPLAGDYTIEVGTERGNAPYKLTVSILGRPRR